MYRKYYLVEVVLLLLLSHGGWNGPSVTLLSCTSETSKLVRDVVQKRFLSVVQRYRVPLPLECPLHPRRDMFWWVKTEVHETWRCPICGQNFRCENTFVTHWDASHARALGRAVETVCLDEYCDVFRCDVLRQRQQEEEDVQAVVPKERSCNPTTLTTVHSKCRSLVRQCTIGMLANLSSKDFQDIEEDLDEAICSFLTCDKYWDDFDSQIRHVPALIIAFFGLLIITSFCFCYYGTWILLEKQPTYTNLVCCNCQNPATEVHRKARKPEFNYRHKTNYKQSRSGPQQKITYGHYLTEQKHRSPKFNRKLNSPEFITPKRVSRRKYPDYCSRQNSPTEYNSRQNSPEYASRNNSPEYSSRQNSPEYASRNNSPEYISSRNSPEYAEGNVAKYISRHSSPEYTREQNSEYLSRKSPLAIKGKESMESEAYHRAPSRCNNQRSGFEPRQNAD